MKNSKSLADLESKYLPQLIELLKIPSVSALSQHKPDIKKTVAWLEKKLTKIGLETKTYSLKTIPDGNPIIFAQTKQDKESKQKPTILIYGHYDVQPPDPIEEWKTDPFNPEIKNNNIYARGATDDKGQLFTHLAALEELSEMWGENWPINIKMVIEGEEEVGGKTISAWLKSKQTKKLLKSDVCVISDTEFLDEKSPAIEYGLRGCSYFELKVTNADKDLHSGLYGGGLLNPAIALTNILGKLYDQSSGKITVPGFYDQVAELDKQEKEVLAKLKFSEKSWLKNAGNAKSLHGEKNYTTVERTTARPTFDIHGLWSGFSGEGPKTIIPSSASAKFSFRLVANQKPAQIEKLVKNYIDKIAPKQINFELKIFSPGGSPSISDRNSIWMKYAVTAIKNTFGKEPTFTRSGGSIPIVAELQEFLDIESILMGYGLPDDNLHAPNEKFSIKQFTKGILCNMEFYQLCGKQDL
jgi:acetylornithine deacetylase/succinyl-diaminopimelate desuccinylase-like protein